MKYDANKKRAIHFAHRNKGAILCCCAKYTVTLDALRDNPSLPAQKLEWLQRHDRECSDLYGMYPLVKGMPVSLTDHVDRNPEKNLLRGRVGFVHSWALHGQDVVEKHPNSVALKKVPIAVSLSLCLSPPLSLRPPALPVDTLAAQCTLQTHRPLQVAGGGSDGPHGHKHACAKAMQ